MPNGSRRRTLAVLALVLLAAVAYGMVGWLRGEPVRALAVAEREVLQSVVAIGTVTPPARVRLGSVMLGTVASVTVAEGAPVAAGQLLVELEHAVLHAEVQRAHADEEAAKVRLENFRKVEAPSAGAALREAEALLANAARELERTHKLAEQGGATQVQIDAAQASLASASKRQEQALLAATSAAPSGSAYRLALVALSQASAALAAAEARLAQTLINAPADGVILARRVEAGDVVQPGQELLVLATSGDPEVRVAFDEKSLGLLAVGQRALVSADAFPGRSLPAEVAWIAPAVDAQRGTIEARLRLLQGASLLRIDMTVSVEVEVARKEKALALPATAVAGLGTGAPSVLLVSDGTARRQKVALGVRGRDLVEVVAGIRAGDLVALEPTKLGDGARVRPQIESLPVAAASGAAVAEGR